MIFSYTERLERLSNATHHNFVRPDRTDSRHVRHKPAHYASNNSRHNIVRHSDNADSAARPSDPYNRRIHRNANPSECNVYHRHNGNPCTAVLLHAALPPAPLSSRHKHPNPVNRWVCCNWGNRAAIDQRHRRRIRNDASFLEGDNINGATWNTEYWNNWTRCTRHTYRCIMICMEQPPSRWNRISVQISSTRTTRPIQSSVHPPMHRTLPIPNAMYKWHYLMFINIMEPENIEGSLHTTNADILHTT